MDEFILNTDELNAYGYRILTAGIQTGRFEKNPIALLAHIRINEWNTPNPIDKLPIGNWLEMKKLPTVMTAKLRVDDVTELDKAVAGKVKSGTLRTASIGIRILEWSDDPSMLVVGQTRPTVTKCELLEASVTDIPANQGCVKLYYLDKEVALNGGKDDEEKLNSILPIIKLNHSDNTMKTVFAQLKLKDGSSEADVLAAVTNLENAKLALENKVKDLEKSAEDAKKLNAETNAKALVQMAIDAKKITESQRASWESLAIANYDSAKTALDGMKGFASLSSQVVPSEKSNSDLDDKAKYDKMWKENKLSLWEKENPEEFKRCQMAYFGA